MPIEVANLSKTFGQAVVLRGLNETFADGEISVLLGASGCGKTTTLRCIAGLERPSAGSIAIDGRTVYRDAPPVFVPAERRRIAMVFQSYAIWPHMTVAQNVGLPLRAAGGDRRSIAQKVGEALDLVGLGALAARSATQLSGGQQQRVALARCIVSGSPVILMDEPLSNLDANLRIAMRTEIRNLQRRLGQMILFVTHDQEEAMSIADTVYLMRDGAVLQKGSPREFYENPKTRYAAEFLGRANIIDAFVREPHADAPQIRLGDLTLPAPAGLPADASLCIRPEKWRAGPADAPGTLAGRIVETRYVGDRLEFVADTPVGRISVVEMSDADRRPGEPVGLTVAPRDVKWVQ
jgi:ABC-type Fe3+/spermidine/putrescine transport system ATPase subunit